uniref:Uncharacterized protein n=1 Tax=Lotharella globosa TaxID=91324 RepID=A0A7S4DQM5_9EUKA|mmetsp:Transcript_5850/g.10600  ORF Transcript_5850/g.10600 Transcript_5850/m.10600 type:complete len:382 (-) Transcript_5850:670-1815(-)
MGNRSSCFIRDDTPTSEKPPPGARITTRDSKNLAAGTAGARDSRVPGDIAGDDDLTTSVVATAVAELRAIRIAMEDVRRMQALEMRSRQVKKPPLTLAAKDGDLDTVRFLIKRLKLPVQPNGEAAERALTTAAESGHLTCVKFLIKEAMGDPNAVDAKGRTALMGAVRGAKEDVVKFLLDHGAALMWADKSGFSALHHALSIQDEEETVSMLSLLIERKANLEKTNEEGNTFLLHALSVEADIEVVKYLVGTARANVNTANVKNGQTALMIASGSLAHTVPNLDVLQYLLEEAKADHRAADHEQMTAKSYAYENNHDDVVEILEDFESKQHDDDHDDEDLGMAGEEDDDHHDEDDDDAKEIGEHDDDDNPDNERDGDEEDH